MKQKRKKLAQNYIRMATFNLQHNIQQFESKTILFEDMKNYNIDFACLQETHCDDFDGNNYGQVEYISNRISIIQFTNKNGKIISLLNIYAPTSQRAASHPEETINIDLNIKCCNVKEI